MKEAFSLRGQTSRLANTTRRDQLDPQDKGIANLVCQLPIYDKSVREGEKSASKDVDDLAVSLV